MATAVAWLEGRPLPKRGHRPKGSRRPALMNASKRRLLRAYNLAPLWVAAVALYRKLGAQLRPAIAGFVSLTLLTGCVFPLVLYAIAQAAFAEQAGGSLVRNHGVVVGSRLIGQAFSQPGYFHPRPSAAGAGYDGLASGGANLAPSNPKFFLTIRDQAAAYRRENGLTPDTPVPTDAVTSSGSGLDPHISPADAALQVRRVARARGLGEDRIRALVAAHTEASQL